MGTDPEPLGADRVVLHASCVSVEDRAVLITGASGTGKSALALTLMAFGARLVSDDGTILSPSGEAVTVAPVPEISGLIEARGVGLLKCPPPNPAQLQLVVDMNQVETARMPETREISFFGRAFRLLHKVESPHFAPAILHYLKEKQGRVV
ncbi:MAG: HPr kinase/phosphorylase [Paracoccaceae bacterium]